MASHALERVAIVGAAGQLGRELVAAFGDRAIPLERRDLDVEDPATIEGSLRRFRPTVVINTAAYHDLLQCELHPDRALAVNALAVERLASACALAGCTLAHVSTDYVFDGRLQRPYHEDDEPRPLQVYGISKLAGEQFVLRHPGNFVFRTSGLYGRGGSRVKGQTFVERVVRQARAGEPIRVVDDVTFSPTYAPHAAAAIELLLQRGLPGIYHVTNASHCTWYEFAQTALRIAGYPREIAATSEAALAGGFIRRPAFTALDHPASRRAGIPEPPPWIEGLAAYIAESDLSVESP